MSASHDAAGLNFMNANDEKVRAAIAEQAGAWFVANDDGPLNARDSAALAAWLKASPVHVEEFLGVSVIARDLREAGTDPEYSIEAVIARAQADDAPEHRLWPGAIGPVRDLLSRRWLPVAVTMAALSLLSLGLLSVWKARPIAPAAVTGGTTTLHYETHHGEQLSRRLADNSVLHLDTDSAVTVRYGKSERLVMLTAGQAAFEVVHEAHRAFRVSAGAAEVVAVGTRFDVRLEHDSTVVTVVEGRVSVGPSAMSGERGTEPPTEVVRLDTGQQLRVTAGQWPATPVNVDAQYATAWLRHELVFDHEPLERVAAEFNRYAPKPIEIATPALRNLQITGVFATDHTEEFIAFLRSLRGVRVEVTATRILVSQD